jgi:hypothetical protein
MGASNALAAYALYASKVSATPLAVLVYMALVSMDDDTEPWWSQGHDVLAVHAMGREPLVPTGDEKADRKARDAMQRAVERTITPLYVAGAITQARHSSGRPGSPQHVRYRLWLAYPAPDGKRRVEHRSAPDGKRRVDNRPDDTHDQPAPDGKRRARSASTRRKVSEHPTESVAAPDGNRGTKEYEEYEERTKKQEYMDPVVAAGTGIARERVRNEGDGFPVASVTDRPNEVPVIEDDRGRDSQGRRCRYAQCRSPSSPVEPRQDYHPACEYLAKVKTLRTRPGPAVAVVTPPSPYPDDHRDELPEDFGDGEHIA